MTSDSDIHQRCYNNKLFLKLKISSYPTDMFRRINAKMGYYSIFHFTRRHLIQYPLFMLFAFVICAGIGYLYHQSVYKGFYYMEKTILPKLLRLPNVVVHFDLKGAPPNINYLRSILRGIRDLGANAILLEYEDMFPFENGIKNVSTPFHYRKDDLKKFLQRASDLNLEVIPLIQTFGHLEYALKLEEFHHLREHPLHSDAICPSKNESLDLLKNMIQQIVNLHQSISPLKHIHIGADEVFLLNVCNDCTKRGLTHTTLYIQHLKAVAEIIKPLVSDVTILIWDDMLRRSNITFDLQKDLIQLASEYPIQPVVWDYTANLSALSHKHMYLYQKAFKNLWIASAYKGADGNEAFTPDLQQRLLNNLNWLKFAKKYNRFYNVNGIILTGWSRYTHFQPICELLPVSYPSLTTILMLINDFKTNLSKDNEYIDVYTINEWNLASKIYFDDHLRSLQSCPIDGAYQMRPECSLHMATTFELYRHVDAYEDAIRKCRQYINNFDLDARIVFDYMDVTSTFEFMKKNEELVSAVRITEQLLIKSMRYFFDANVYQEYTKYKSYSTYEYQKSIPTKLAHIVDMSLTKYGKILRGPKIVWPRGRKYLLNINKLP